MSGQSNGRSGCPPERAPRACFRRRGPVAPVPAAAPSTPRRRLRGSGATMRPRLRGHARNAPRCAKCSPLRQRAVDAGIRQRQRFRAARDNLRRGRVGRGSRQLGAPAHRRPRDRRSIGGKSFTGQHRPALHLLAALLGPVLLDIARLGIALLGIAPGADHKAGSGPRAILSCWSTASRPTGRICGRWPAGCLVRSAGPRTQCRSRGSGPAVPVPPAECVAASLGAEAEVTGAQAVACTFSGRALAARPEKVDGAAGAVWAPGPEAARRVQVLRTGRQRHPDRSAGRP